MISPGKRFPNVHLFSLRISGRCTRGSKHKANPTRNNHILYNAGWEG